MLIKNHLRFLILTLASWIPGSLAQGASDPMIPFEVNDELSNEKIPDANILYYFENHEAEALITPKKLREQTSEMIGMSMREQGQFFKKIVPELLSHPYLSIDQIVGKDFLSKQITPLDEIVTWKYVWYKFSLVYTGSKENRRFFIKPGFGCDYCYLYSRTSDGALKFEGYAGRIMPKLNSEHPYTGNFFPIILEPHKPKEYFLLFRDQYTHLQPEVLSEEAFNDESTLQLVIEAFVLGATLFAIVYYAFLGVYSKDPSYTNFAYLLVNYILWLLSTQSLLKYLSIFPVFVVYPESTIIIHLLVYVNVIRFMLPYLDGRRFPRPYLLGRTITKIATFIAVALFPLSQFGVINMFTFFIIFIVIAAVSVCYCSLFMVYRALKKERSGVIFTGVGAAVAIAVVVSYIFFFLGRSDDFFVSHYNIIKLAFFLAFTGFSFDLGTRLKIANEKLQIYIDQVEDLVAEKTAKIRSIMNNIKVGIFTIENPEKMEISSEYSSELTSILGTNEIEGHSAQEVFLDKLNLNSDSQSQILNFISSSLGEDSINFDFNKHLAPSSLEMNIEKSKKFLEVEWGTVLRDDIVEKIIVSVKDVTQDKENEAAAAASKRELEIIDKILGVDEAVFSKFLSDAKGFIENNRNLVENNDKNDPEVVKVLFINMHTLKGAARGYQFTHMTGCIHDIEQSYAMLQRNEKQWNREELIEDLEELECLIHEYQDISTKKLGRQIEVDVAKVDRSMIKNVIDLVARFPHKNDKDKEVARYYSDLYFKNIRNLIKKVLEQVPMLARDLGKEEPSILIDGDVPGIDGRGADILENALIHIVRNSMDHGIETADDREKIGKDRKGSLVISLASVEGFLNVDISDDGKGLDLNKIRHLGVERNLLEQDQSYTKEKIASMILESGFSTASAVTDISGRGVGMDAVRRYLEGIGGSLGIDLGQPHEKTGCFAFKLSLKIPDKFLAQAV